MPKFYRSMLSDGDKPRTGSDANLLGVSLPPYPNADIVPDGMGNVHPETGGMSVAPAIGRLPGRLIPMRLRERYPKATGNDELTVWTMGHGEFGAEAISSGLALRPDPKRPNGHGFVEPDVTMPVRLYQEALYGTQDNWTRDES